MTHTLPARPVTISLKLAVAVLDVGRTRAYELARDGHFDLVPAHRVGRRYVVSVGQIAERLSMPLEEVYRRYREVARQMGYEIEVDPEPLSRPA